MRLGEMAAFCAILVGISACQSGGVSPSLSADTSANIPNYLPSPNNSTSPTPIASAMPSPQPCASPSAIPYSFSGGSGTVGSPYILQTSTDIQHMKDFLGAYYTLEGNVDMTGVILSPIGSASSPFSGTFYGNNNEISNITMVATDGSTVAFFGAVSGSVVGLTIEVNMSSNGLAAGLVGVLTGNIMSCTVYGSVTAGQGGNGYNVGQGNGIVAAAGAGETCQFEAQFLPYLLGTNCEPASGPTIYNSGYDVTFNGAGVNESLNFGNIPPIYSCSGGTCSATPYVCEGPNPYSLFCSPPSH